MAIVAILTTLAWSSALACVWAQLRAWLAICGRAWLPISPVLLNGLQQLACLRTRSRGNAHEPIAAKIGRAVSQQDAPAREAAHQGAGTASKIGKYEIGRARKHARAQPRQALCEFVAAFEHLANVAANKLLVAQRGL